MWLVASWRTRGTFAACLHDTAFSRYECIVSIDDFTSRYSSNFFELPKVVRFDINFSKRRDRICGMDW